MLFPGFSYYQLINILAMFPDAHVYLLRFLFRDWIAGSWCYGVIFPVVTDTNVNFSLILGCFIGELFYASYL